MKSDVYRQWLETQSTNPAQSLPRCIEPVASKSTTATSTSIMPEIGWEA